VKMSLQSLQAQFFAQTMCRAIVAVGNRLHHRLFIASTRLKPTCAGGFCIDKACCHCFVVDTPKWQQIESRLGFTNLGAADEGKITYAFTGGQTLTRTIQRFMP